MRIRPFGDQDFPALADFEAAHAGGALLSYRPLFDRVYRSPWSEGFGGMIAEDEGKIEAVALTICVPGMFATRSLILTWPAVILASPKGQAVGAGAQLALWHYRNRDLVPSMNGTEQGNRLKDLLAKSDPAVVMSRFVFVHDREAAAFCAPDRREPALAHRFPDPAVGRGGLSWRWSETITPELDALWAEFRETLALTSERNREVLTWRYVDFPVHSYRFIEIREDNGKLAALAVVRLHETPKGRVCRIVDFIGHPGRTSGAWSAIAEAAAGSGAVYSDFFMVGRPFADDLLIAGFLPDTPETGLAALPNLLSPIDPRHWIYSFHLGGRLAGGNDCWRDPRAVYFTKGDCDRDYPNRHALDALSSP